MAETKEIEKKSEPKALAAIDIVRLRLNAARDRFARALARKGIDPDEFIIGIMTQMNSTPKLIECTPESVLLSAFKGAMLGLRFDGVSGHAFMIPRRRKVGEKKYILEANFQIGYQGILEHIYRSKDVKSVFAAAVHEEDEWSPPRYTEQGVTFLHAPNLEVEDRGPIIAGYVKFRLARDEEPLVFVLPIHQIYRDHRDRSQAYDAEDDDCPWIKDEEAMVVKTMYIVGGKYAPKSIHATEIVNMAERLDKGIPVYIPGAEEATERPLTLAPESLLHPQEVTGEDNAKVEKKKTDREEARAEVEKAVSPEAARALVEGTKPKQAPPQKPKPREPGEDDVMPEDEEVAGLFPD